MTSATQIVAIEIQDAVVFDSVKIQLASGFNIFSGASGAGKSVLMKCILSVFGLGDVDAGNIMLELKDNSRLQRIKGAKKRYTLNSSSITTKALRETFGDVYHLSLKDSNELKTESLLELLDAFIIKASPSFNVVLCRMRELFLEFRELDSKHKELLSDKENLEALRERALRDIELIESIAPREGEYEELLELKKNLSRIDKISTLISNALSSLEGMNSVKMALNALDVSSQNFEDAICEVRSIIETKDYELEKLRSLSAEDVLDRLEKLAHLNKRYGGVDSALKVLDKQKQKLAELCDLEFSEADIVRKRDRALKECQAISSKIAAIRESMLLEFSNALNELCAELKLANPEVVLSSSELKSSGENSLEISLNGSGIKTQSSGEYSRLRLAVMALKSSIINTQGGVVILDEIDANLSGSESEGVARVLKRLSANYQILAISHQIHMPTFCDAHFLVSRKGDKSSVERLDDEGRVREVARLISGEDIDEQALEFVRRKLSL